MNRRRFLGSAAGVGLGLTAGCLSDDTDTYATLQSLRFANPNDDVVAVDLRIERADTDAVVHAETLELTPEFVESFTDCVWPNAPVTILVRHADGEWERFTTADRDGCVSALADISDRDVSFYAHTADCPIRDPDCHTAVGE